jgi:hypothetical protein
MATTTFSGPVVSQNGFIGGTASSPIAVTTAQNVSSSYVTSSATTGDTRLMYDKLTFTSTGSGETARFFTVVTGANAATAGTINGAHISCEIDGASASISGAANAIRATLGGTDTTPGGTLAVIQLDTNFGSSGVSTPATSSFMRVTDSGTGTGKINNLFNIAAGPAATLLKTSSVGAAAAALKIVANGTTYYIMLATSAT